MPFSATLYEELGKLDSTTRAIIIKVLKEIEFNIGELVTRKDFDELKDEVKKLTKSVQELAAAQKKTEKTVNELAKAQKRTEQTLNELSEAQKRTEQRLEALTQRVDELAEAQKRTEQRLEALTQRVDELAEAQKKTEQTLKELAEAQKITEQRINELTEAQKKTEQTILELKIGLKETREQLGGLSDTVGYTLENEAYKALPNLLKRDYGIEIEGRLKRGYLKDRKGRDVEVNILGKGRMNGKEVTIIGESKVRLSKKAVKDFIEIRLKNFESLYGEIFPVLVTHMISEPDVEEYAKEKGIALYYSYDF